MRDEPHAAAIAVCRLGALTRWTCCLCPLLQHGQGQPLPDQQAAAAAAGAVVSAGVPGCRRLGGWGWGWGWGGRGRTRLPHQPPADPACAVRRSPWHAGSSCSLPRRGYEASPFVKVVREALCELEIPHVMVRMGSKCCPVSLLCPGHLSWAAGLALPGLASPSCRRRTLRCGLHGTAVDRWRAGRRLPLQRSCARGSPKRQELFEQRGHFQVGCQGSQTGVLPLRRPPAACNCCWACGARCVLAAAARRCTAMRATPRGRSWCTRVSCSRRPWCCRCLTWRTPTQARPCLRAPTSATTWRCGWACRCALSAAGCVLPVVCSWARAGRRCLAVMGVVGGDRRPGAGRETNGQSQCSVRCQAFDPPRP